MDVVLANKRPLTDRRPDADALLTTARAQGDACCSRRPWAPGFP